MNIAICDDEASIREQLGKKVRKLYPDAELELCETGEELLLQEREPDILFLDIQLPGKNGMEIARELRKKWSRVILIFVTAIEEYVFQAFDVGAFHYLVKPFADEKLLEVMEKAEGQLKRERQSAENVPKERYMMVNAGGSHIKIRLDDIIFAEVFNRKVVIHTVSDTIEYYGKLSELEKSLGEDFFRPHRAYLIHFKYVVRYHAASVTLTNGTAMMAKAKFAEFVKSYLKYNQRRGKEIE